MKEIKRCSAHDFSFRMILRWIGVFAAAIRNKTQVLIKTVVHLE